MRRKKIGSADGERHESLIALPAEQRFANPMHGGSDGQDLVTLTIEFMESHLLASGLRLEQTSSKPKVKLKLDMSDDGITIAEIDEFQHRLQGKLDAGNSILRLEIYAKVRK